jgi:hypothetical protein
MREVTIDNVLYYTRSAPCGYGYEIIKEEKIGEKKKKRSLYFTTYDNELFRSIFYKMKDTQKLPDALPNTSSEIPPPKVLVHDTKHYRYHYFVDTPEKLKKACIKTLKERVDENYYYKANEPTNDSGIDSLDELDDIPKKFAGMRTTFERKFKDYQREVIEYKSSMVDWSDLQRILDDEDLTVRFIWNVINKFEGDSLSLEDMDVVV